MNTKLASRYSFALTFSIFFTVNIQAASYTFFTDPSLEGVVTFFDPYLGNSDDQFFPNINTFGAASQFLNSNGTYGFLTGDMYVTGLTIIGPTDQQVFGGNQHESVFINGQWNFDPVFDNGTEIIPGSYNNPLFQNLDFGSSAITVNSDQTFTTSFIMHDNALGGRLQINGTGNYLLNGQDASSLYAGDLLTHFELITPLLPTEWQTVAQESQMYEVLDGDFAGVTGFATMTFFSTEVASIPQPAPVPLGAPWMTTGVTAIDFQSDIYVGGDGADGTATLADGNIVSTDGVVRLDSLAIASLTIEGSGTALTLPSKGSGFFGRGGGLLISPVFDGVSTLNVLDGGTVSTPFLELNNTGGDQFQGETHISVSGPGSTLNFSCPVASVCDGPGAVVGILDFGPLLGLGGGGSSNLPTTPPTAITVEQGGRINVVADGNQSAGIALFGHGALTVDGENSEIHIIGSQTVTDPSVGQTAQVLVEQSTTLSVTNGGKLFVERGNTALGGVFTGSILGELFPAAPAKVIVDGANSTIDAGQVFALGEVFQFDPNTQQYFDAGPGGASEGVVSNGGLVKADKIIIGQTSTLSGNGGTLEGQVENFGTVGPGASPGILNIVGDYNQAAEGTLVIEIGGADPGMFDVLNVSGTATLGGTLQIDLVNGFTPQESDTFDFLVADIFAGDFDNFVLPTFGSNQTFAVSLGPNGFTADVAPIPVPAALWLFAPGIVALGFARRKTH